jgi:hypothetical protein
MSGLQIGDIDIGDQVVDNEYRIKFLTKLVEWIINQNNLKAPSPNDISAIRNAIVSEMNLTWILATNFMSRADRQAEINEKIGILEGQMQILLQDRPQVYNSKETPIPINSLVPTSNP